MLGQARFVRQRSLRYYQKLISVCDAPRYLRSDYGPKFVSLALLKWVVDQQLESVLIDPGEL